MISKKSSGTSKKTVSFDLETIANPAMVPLLPEVTPKKGLTDEAKIKKSIKEKTQTQLDGMPLDPKHCLIACFGWATATESGHILLEDEQNEKKLVTEMWEILNKYNHFTGFNSWGFDVPVMLMRSLFNRIRPSVNISQRKYSTTTNHTDIRMVLANWDKFATGKLDWYEKVLLDKQVRGISGDQIADYWEMGLKTEIGIYCEDQCQSTLALYKLIKEYYLL